MEKREEKAPKKSILNKGEAKKGEKIALKNFIKKELQTVNYNSTPEKLGEDFILSLLKPLEVYSKFLSQTVEKKEDIKEKYEKENTFYSVKINDEEYKFTKYSEDYKKIIVEDKEGKVFEIENNTNLTFIIGPEKKFTETEHDILQKGKALITSDKNGVPFKMVRGDKENKDSINLQTVTRDEYKSNKKKSLLILKKRSKL